jgi:hypothetical protein
MFSRGRMNTNRNSQAMQEMSVSRTWEAERKEIFDKISFRCERERTRLPSSASDSSFSVSGGHPTSEFKPSYRFTRFLPNSSLLYPKCFRKLSLCLFNSIAFQGDRGCEACRFRFIKSPLSLVNATRDLQTAVIRNSREMRRSEETQEESSSA